MAFKYAILIVSICLRSRADPKSPCPNIFNYQLRDDSTDRWYGLFNLASDEDIVGVRLKFTLDKAALQLGNLFGKATTYDLKEFTITNNYLRLAPNSSHLLRFYVAYDPYKPAPMLISIEQNDRRICPDPGHREAFLSVLLNRIPESTTLSLSNPPIEDSINEIECGTIAVQASPLIIGGDVSEVGAYPWHVAIFRIKNGKLIYKCGGSLVSKQAVVTTIVCLGIDRSVNEDVEVHLGKQYLNEISYKVQIRKVSGRIPHPGYNRSLGIYNNNIGLLKLKEPVTFTDFVRPVCLIPPHTNFENVIGNIGTVPGWGRSGSTNQSEELRYAMMKVVTPEACSWSKSNYDLTRNSFCMRPVKQSECLGGGDGGGGLVFPDDSEGRRIYYLRGIAWHGTENCIEPNFLYFTEVRKDTNFIIANL